ncbi:LysR family transcriptional regulator [Adlercreutzia caecimuris]|jgi:DNA-binding transcriptional LysR family regulator|nr:LysR family transcriptional regulator [Adlercreutzia caecimuris]
MVAAPDIFRYHRFFSGIINVRRLGGRDARAHKGIHSTGQCHELFQGGQRAEHVAAEPASPYRGIGIRARLQLFERNPLTLTTAGCHYLEGISTLINDVDSLTARCQSIAAGSRESLVICSIPFDLGPYSRIVYESIARMRTACAAFAPTFFYSGVYTIPEAIYSGKADIGVVFSMPHEIPEGFTCDPLMDYRGMIWAHKDNPGLKVSPIRAQNFAGSVLVDSTNRMYTTWRDGELEVLEKAGVSPNSCLRGIENSADFFIMMRRNEIKVTMDLGTTICPYNPDVVGVLPEDDEFVIRTYLLYGNRPVKPQVASFVDLAKQVAAETL